MCRIFAVRSREPWAIAPAFERLKQLSVVHKDGWGVVNFDDEATQHHRDISPAHCSEKFHELGASLLSRNLLAHIREASVGDLHEDNTHPFCADRWVFCHNGTVRGFSQAREPLESRIASRWRSRIKGDTDSERLFYVFLTYLGEATDLTSVSRALTRTVTEVSQLYPGTDPAKPTALNLFITDGQISAVTRFNRSLFYVARDDLSMIASEPMIDREHWEELPERYVLTVDEGLRTQWVAM
jgi:glutamine amidotransferase